MSPFVKSALSVGILALCVNASAATKTWDAGGAATDLNWLTPANWNADSLPAAGDDLVFATGPAAGNRIVTNNFAANTVFHDIRITATSYALWGNAINITGNVTNTGGNPATINLGLALQQDTYFSVGSGQRIDMNGDISGSFGLIKADVGTLRLQSAGKTYSGNTTVAVGTLDLNVANALPSGAGKGNVTVNSGSSLGLRFGQNINGLNGGGLVSAFSSGTKVLTLGFGDASGIYSGAISNGSGIISLTKTGSGTQTLNGINAYTGATTVSAGTLLLNSYNASSSLTVAAAGTLGGNAGIIEGASTINGTLDPGTAPGSIGILNFNNNLTLNLGSTILIQLDRSAGQNADYLSVVGTLNLGGNWLVSNIGASLLAGDTFNLFDAGTTTGTAGLLNLPSLDSGLDWDTSLYNTSGVISVVAVPEPTILALVGAGLLLGRLARREQA